MIKLFRAGGTVSSLMERKRGRPQGTSRPRQGSRSPRATND
nr:MULTISPECIES: hypothetical protein [unclassified Mesorhizobium]